MNAYSTLLIKCCDVEVTDFSNTSFCFVFKGQIVNDEHVS